MIIIIMTKFILFRGKAVSSTRDIKAVQYLKTRGWKIKLSSLGELI